MFFRRPTRCEGPKISPLSGFGVLLSRVQAVLTCFKFPYHLSVLLWTFIRPTFDMKDCQTARLFGSPLDGRLGAWWANIRNLPVLRPVELVHDTVHYRRENEAHRDQEYQACVECIQASK